MWIPTKNQTKMSLNSAEFQKSKYVAFCSLGHLDFKQKGENFL